MHVSSDSINLPDQVDLDGMSAAGIDPMDAMVVHRADADPDDVIYVLSMSPELDDARSQWQWFRLPNGDLILGVFPQGSTYFDVTDSAGV